MKTLKFSNGESFTPTLNNDRMGQRKAIELKDPGTALLIPKETMNNLNEFSVVFWIYCNPCTAETRILTFMNYAREAYYLSYSKLGAQKKSLGGTNNYYISGHNFQLFSHRKFKDNEWNHFAWLRTRISTGFRYTIHLNGSIFLWGSDTNDERNFLID